MKISQSEAIKAYKTVLNLNKQKFSSGKIAKNIYDLYTELQPIFQFQIQEENKIFSEYPDFDPQLGGIKLTNDPEQREKAKRDSDQIDDKLKELAELENEIKFEPFELSFDQLEADSIKISGEDIGNLSKFIKFI